jgi:aminopeptidase N
VTDTSTRDRLTQDEARARAGQISNVAYRLDLDLEAGAKTFRGDVTISFDHAGGDTFLEWLGSITTMEVNGEPREAVRHGSRVALPGDWLAEHNEVRIAYERAYDHTGEGLHQFIDPADGAEYLYTQFEPYGAHRMLPCFDQPDLKATYELTITAPADWAVVTSGREIDREEVPGGRSRRVFARTVPFSTYLLSVVAGEYASVTDEHNGIPLGMHARASLMPYLDSEPLFELTKRLLDFYGEFFEEPYPFDKLDQVFIAEFNWGGMENVANITYTDTVIFRDPPTNDQLVRRAEYFAHEVAHMWFGDLVTMQWWNDIWLNESFASYVAYFALDAIGGYPTIWQDFNYRMKLWAYREDQMPTTHQIAGEAPSTDETFLNFDGISYGKGAAVLKQLVAAIGPDAFRDGLRAYFRRHRFGNAALADFLAALQEGSGRDLVKWASRWLTTANVNTLAATWDETNGVMDELTLRQTAPEAYPVLRPHRIDVAIIDRAGVTTVLPATIDGVTAKVPDAAGRAVPAFVYPNHGDHGYVKVALDPTSVRYAEDRLGDLDDPLLRQLLWESLWEMVRDAQLPSTTYLSLVAAHLPGEESMPIVQMVTATVAAAIARYVPEASIDAAAAAFSAVAAATVRAHPAGDRGVLWARALIGVARSEADVRLATDIVDSPPEELAIDQDMRWGIAIKWAALDLEGNAGRVAAERARDDSDRGERAVVTADASRPDLAAKQEVWDRLHGNGYGSLAMMKAAAAGFWRRGQRELLAGFVGPYFDGLHDLFDSWEPEAARAYFRTFYPDYLIDTDARSKIAAVLERPEVGPMLRRLLQEADDDIRRALECRALASSSSD